MTVARKFDAVPAVRGEEPVSVGMVGPPGGGKTFSALRLAKGMQAVRGGDIIVIDTEAGRARKYADQFKFLHVNFDPPHRPDAFLEAIEQQVRRKSAAIIIDSMSDEHEGQGGYLEWHDEMIPKMGGNEWAAWSKPKAARKQLITGLLHIKTPLIFTFRAREKTKQGKDDKGRTVITNIGWQPVAPLEIVHSLDLTCILPPRADGVPVWKSDKIGEDFIIKLPLQFRKLLGGSEQLDENIGRAIAEWSRGPISPAGSQAVDEQSAPEQAPQPDAGADPLSEEDALFDSGLAKAAKRGDTPQERWASLKTAWEFLPDDAQDRLRDRLNTIHKATARGE